MPVNKKWSRIRAPHRTLYSGSRGLDVAQLQHALNKRIDAREEFGFKNIKAGGNFNPPTRKAWIAMCKAIGLHHRKCSVGNQILMRSPAKRSPAMVKKARGWLARARTALKRKKASAGGAGAVRYAESLVGKTETGYNDAPWLRAMERDILKAGYSLGWMIPGQPYCGFGCIWAWLKAGKKLPAGTVYTPNICGGGAYGHRVSASKARPGDLVVMNFGSGGAKHVALARGPARGGVIPTIEFNTSPGNGGSQANGGGVWRRSRSLGQVLCVVRP